MFACLLACCSVYGADWSCKAPIKLVHASYAKSKQHQDEEVVVLSKVLTHDLNLGYQDTGNIQVLAVNGTKVGVLLGGQAARQCVVRDGLHRCSPSKHHVAASCSRVSSLTCSLVPAPLLQTALITRLVGCRRCLAGCQPGAPGLPHQEQHREVHQAGAGVEQGGCGRWMPAAGDVVSWCLLKKA